MREDYPQEKPNMKKVGLLMLILIGIMVFYFLDGFYSNSEEQIECDPEFDNCDRLKIIVRFIVINEQLLSYT